MTIEPLVDAEIIEPDDLDTLAALANRYHAEAENAVQGAVEFAWRAGQALISAKKQCAHGEWLPWLEGNFVGTARTATNYMMLASNQKRVSDLDTSQSIRGALKAISARKPEPRPAAPKPRRRSIEDQARTAGWELRKAIERIERIAADDRFNPQIEKVTPQLRGHLIHAVEVCQTVLDRINNTPKDK